MNLSRRRWLAAATTFGIGAGFGTRFGTGSRVSDAVAAESVRTIELEARESRWELAPGRTVRALTYNGQVPGPEIRAREGERLRIVLKNALSEPTTIHWHGVDVPNAMDGVPDVTQKAVPPGGTFIYEFDARPAGTRWYHTHFQEHRQMDLGLVAPLIIEPSTKDRVPYDREVTLVLDDWATGVAKPLPLTSEGTAGGRGSMGGMMGGMMGRGGMMGGRGMGGMMGGGMMGRSSDHTPAYDTLTINGKAYPATTPLRVEKGERVRLRLINASAEHTHVIRLAGHRLAVTHTDGNALTEPVEVDALPMAPSERYDVVVTAERPGAWFLYCAQPGHAAAGEQLLVQYVGHEAKRPEPPEPGIANLILWQYGQGAGRDVLAAATGMTHTFDLTLSGGMMGSDRWTINGKVYPDTDRLRVANGDRVMIRLRNMSMEAHPMHLHGQSFRVLAVNGARLAAPIVKDSVDVEGHMGSVVLDFTASNSGDWFFHCHKPMHMEGGMIALVAIR